MWVQQDESLGKGTLQPSPMTESHPWASSHSERRKPTSTNSSLIPTHWSWQLRVHIHACIHILKKQTKLYFFNKSKCLQAIEVGHLRDKEVYHLKRA